MIFQATSSTTYQEVFDFSVEHMAKQGRPSVKFGRDGHDESGTTVGSSICAYRGDNGAMCAAGPFLPDEIAKRYESSAICHVIKAENLTLLMPFEHLLMNLQTAHDGAYNKDDLQMRLKKIATDRELKFDKINLIVEWKV